MAVGATGSRNAAAARACLVVVRVSQPKQETSLGFEGCKETSTVAPDGARNCTSGRLEWAMVSIFMRQA